MTGIFRRIAEHDAFCASEVLPLDARNSPEIGLHYLEEFTADAFQHLFAVYRRRRFTEETRGVDVRLRQHNKQHNPNSASYSIA